MKTEAVRVSNPRWLKAAIVLGVAFFAAGALFGLWMAVFDEAAEGPERVTMAVLSVLFAWLTSAGYVLLPYLNQALLLDDDGFTSDLRGKNSRHSWESVRFRIRETLQIVEVTDPSGRMISAFDFYAANATYLLFYAQNRRQVQP
jgi:hypothetical protein